MSLAFLSSAPFWGALSVLASFISLALRRGTIFGLALVLSLLTDLIFIDDIVNAIATECNGTGVQGATCISGVVGYGASGINFVAWGFKPGFYLFAASGALIITALAILGEEQSKAHPPAEVRRPASVPSD